MPQQQISQEMMDSFLAEEVEAIQRVSIAIVRAEDSAQRAEELGERELFISGFGTISAQDLAEAMRLRAKRLEAALEALITRQVDQNNAATEVAADAVAAVDAAAATEGVVNDGGSGESGVASDEPPAPRRGRPPKPREV